MLLGKRQRGPMRRTTSMTEFAFDLSPTAAEPEQQQANQMYLQQGGGGDWPDTRYLATVATPRGGASGGGSRRRGSVDGVAVETANFLKACGLCKRRLGPGRDTFIYRGEIAFCSLECRQQMIKEEERKEKFLLRSMKNDQPLVSTGSDASGSGETVAAA